jgi:formate dehydrogenase major subunit
MCSLGCKIEYKVFDDGLYTVVNNENGSHNNGYLCAKGRFGYRYMLDRNRLVSPKLRVGSAFESIAWDEAITRSVDKLKAIAAEYGPESIAVFGSPRMSNEELYLLQKLARAGIRTNNIASFTNFVNGAEADALVDMLGHTTSTATLDDLDDADVIVLVNSDPFEENLIAALRIKAAQKKGAKVVVISSFETPMSKAADLWIDAKRGTTAVLLNAVAARLPIDEQFVGRETGGYEAFRKSVDGLTIEAAAEICGVDERILVSFRALLADETNRTMFVYNIDSLWEKSFGDLNAITNTLLATGRIGSRGNGVVVLRDYANSQGLLDMGVNSEFLPGGVRLGNKAGIDRIAAAWKVPLDATFRKTYLDEALEKESIKAMVIFGEDPLHVPANAKLFTGVEFMLVADHFITATAKEADVVIPMSAPTETEGMYTSCDRRVQKSVKIASTKTGLETWQALVRLMQAFGVEQNSETVAAVTNEIAEVNPYYRGVAPGTFWGNGFMKGPFSTSDGKAHFSAFSFEVSPINRIKQDFLATETYFNDNVKRKLTA